MPFERHGGAVRGCPGRAQSPCSAPRRPMTTTSREPSAPRPSFARRSPGGVVARIAVERAADAGRSRETSARRRRARGLLLGPAALRLVPGAVDVVPHESGDCYRVLASTPCRAVSAAPRHAPRRAASAAQTAGGSARSDRPERALRPGRRSRRGRHRQDPSDARVRRAHGSNRARSHRALRVYGDGTDLLPLLDLLEQVGPFETALAGEADAARVIARLRGRR